jgi:replicative DNA helicase
VVKVLTEKDVIKKKIKDIMNPIEANIIGCLWKDPNLYFDFNELDKKMFKNDVWKFFYTIGEKIAAKNIVEIDEMAVDLYIKDYPQAESTYKIFNGYNTVSLVSSVSNIKNIDSYIKDFIKWSAMYDMIDELSFYSGLVDDVKEFNVNELYDFFTAKLNNVFVKADNGIESHKLEDDLDEIISEADKGLNVGMPIPSPILNEEIGGIIKGQIYLIGGLSGAGKTTWLIEQILSAVFEEGEPCVIALNEQDHIKWKQELLTWIINNKYLKDHDESQQFNKKRWRQGHFSDNERDLLHKASQYLKEKMSNNEIILCHFKSYSSKQFIRIVRKYASLGVNKFILDTFKISSDRDNNESFWLSMQEDMRKFDDLCKPSGLNVSLIVTLQLQKGAALQRFLSSNNIGMAKNVLDVASVALLQRRLRNDEYPGEKNEIKAWEPLGGSILSGKEILLDQNKKYIVIFIEKNRNGRSQEFQILAEQELGTLKYLELGICNIPYDL